MDFHTFDSSDWANCFDICACACWPLCECSFKIHLHDTNVKEENLTDAGDGGWSGFRDDLTCFRKRENINDILPWFENSFNIS